MSSSESHDEENEKANLHPKVFTIEAVKSLLDQMKACEKIDHLTNRTFNFSQINVNGISGKDLRNQYIKLRRQCFSKSSIETDLEIIGSAYEKVITHSNYKELNPPPSSGYAIFMEKKLKKIKAKNPDFKGTNFIQNMAALWKALSPEKKQKYNDKHAKLRADFLQQHPEFQNVKKKRVRNPKSENPVKPAPPLRINWIGSGFDLYMKEQKQQGRSQDQKHACYLAYMMLDEAEKDRLESEAKKLTEQTTDYMKYRNEKAAASQENVPKKRAKRKKENPNDDSIVEVASKVAKNDKVDVVKHKSKKDSDDSDSDSDVAKAKVSPKKIVVLMSPSKSTNHIPDGKISKKPNVDDDSSSSDSDDENVKKLPTKSVVVNQKPTVVNIGSKPAKNNILTSPNCITGTRSSNESSDSDDSDEKKKPISVQNASKSAKNVEKTEKLVVNKRPVEKPRKTSTSSSDNPNFKNASSKKPPFDVKPKFQSPNSTALMSVPKINTPTTVTQTSQALKILNQAKQSSDDSSSDSDDEDDEKNRKIGMAKKPDIAQAHFKTFLAPNATSTPNLAQKGKMTKPCQAKTLEMENRSKPIDISSVGPKLLPVKKVRKDSTSSTSSMSDSSLAKKNEVVVVVKKPKKKKSKKHKVKHA